MQPGQASKTAVLVCMARALADGRLAVGRFSDPTALALLPEEERRFVERARDGVAPSGLRERARRVILVKRAAMMAARTVAIDDAVRAAAAPQVVILGAGLDGRAWRMPELASVVVYEVDHPDSQAYKRARVHGLTPRARDVRFVAVDFERDDLDQALAVAGHDRALPTTWVWEGVVMYLTPADVEATLAVLARRSSPGSRLALLYMRPALQRRLVAGMLRRLGEPLRSAYRPEEMRTLLERYGFQVVADQDLPTLAAAMSPELGKEARVLTHLRLATADRAG